MADVLREFAYKLGFDIDDRDLKRVTSQLSNVREGWKGVTAAAKRTAAEFAIVGGAVTAVISKVVLDTAKLGDEAAKTSRQLGLGVEELQELRFAAQRSGVAQASLTTAIRQASRQFSDFRKGTGEAREALEAVGVSVKDITTGDGSLRTVPELLDVAADAIAKTESASERLVLAQRLLGRSGAELIPLLEGGSEGMRKLRAEARELGGILDAEAALAAEQLTDRLTDLGAIAGGLRNQIGAALLPVVNDLASGIIRWYKTNQLVIRQRLDRAAQYIGNAIERIGQVVRDVDAIVRTRLGGWTRVIKGVTAALAGLYGAILALRFAGPLAMLAKGLLAVTMAVTGLTAGFAALGIGVVIAAFVQLVAQIAFVVLAWDDLNTYLAGGDSILGRVIEKVRTFGPNGEAMAKVLEELAQLAGSLRDFMWELAGLIGDVLVERMTRAYTAITTVTGAISALIEQMLRLLGTDISGVLGGVAGIFRRGRTALESGAEGLGSVRESVAARQVEASQQAQQGFARGRQAVSSSVNVNVDARGREAPGQTGAEVGFAVDRALRGALTGAL